jgi:uncharacterized membrane protein YvbJ
MYSLEQQIIAKDLMIETLKMRVQLTDKQIQQFIQTIHLFKSQTKRLENELNSAKDKVFYFDFNCFLTSFQIFCFCLIFRSIATK